MEIRLFFSIEVNVLQTVLAGLVITACVWAFILKQIFIGFREGGGCFRMSAFYISLFGFTYEHLNITVFICLPAIR